MSKKTTTGIAESNSAQIHYEVRGEGPPLLCIAGAFGDAGSWEALAAELADEFTVITYDRRGNSRSPRPAGWTSTSLDEQAADAAGLLDFLGHDSAVVYANSLGGAIGLTLAYRHPDRVQHAILHEPFVNSLLPDPGAALRPMMEPMMPFVSIGDLEGAADALLRQLIGDGVVDKMASPLLGRMLGNVDTLFTIEFRDLSHLTFDVFDLTASLTVAFGFESPSYLQMGARELGRLLKTDQVMLPGGHVPQITHPAAVAQAIKSIVAEPGSAPRKAEELS